VREGGVRQAPHHVEADRADLRHVERAVAEDAPPHVQRACPHLVRPGRVVVAQRRRRRRPHARAQARRGLQSPSRQRAQHLDRHAWWRSPLQTNSKGVTRVWGGGGGVREGGGTGYVGARSKLGNEAHQLARYVAAHAYAAASRRDAHVWLQAQCGSPQSCLSCGTARAARCAVAQLGSSGASSRRACSKQGSRCTALVVHGTDYFCMFERLPPGGEPWRGSGGGGWEGHLGRL